MCVNCICEDDMSSVSGIIFLSDLCELAYRLSQKNVELIPCYTVKVLDGVRRCKPLAASFIILGAILDNKRYKSFAIAFRPHYSVKKRS